MVSGILGATSRFVLVVAFGGLFPVVGLFGQTDIEKVQRAFTGWSDVDLTYSIETTQKLIDQKDWSVLSKCIGIQRGVNDDIRRFQIGLYHRPDGTKVNEYYECFNYSDFEMVTCRIRVDDSSKNFVEDVNSLDPEKFDSAKLDFRTLTVNSHNVPQVSQRKTMDILPVLLGAFGDEDIPTILNAAEAYNIQKSNSSFFGQNCIEYKLETAVGDSRFFFDENFHFIGYELLSKVEDLEEKNLIEKREFLFLSGSLEDEIKVEKGVTSTLTGGKTTGRKSTLLERKKETIMPTDISKPSLNIPNGQEVMMVGRSQLQAYWENGKIKFRYHKNGIEKSGGGTYKMSGSSHSWKLKTFLWIIAASAIGGFFAFDWRRWRSFSGFAS